MPCSPRPGGRASGTASCRPDWWSTTSWPWPCMRRPPTARSCAACWRVCAGCTWAGWIRRWRRSRPITRARSRLGVTPLQRLFRRLAHPFASPGTPGAWYRGHRLVSLDGTTIDLPDTPELEARFGRPAASRGASGFPQLRLLGLTETGTHALFATAVERYDSSEVGLAPQLLAHLRPDMLCLADRAFVGFELWRQAAVTGADLLWRLRANQVLPCRKRLPDGSYLSRLYASPKHRRHEDGGVVVRVIDYRLEGVPDTEPLYRLVTTLLDADAAPAAELAALYHERWES